MSPSRRLSIPGLADCAHPHGDPALAEAVRPIQIRENDDSLSCR